MPNANLYDGSGKDTGKTVELPDAIFGQEVLKLAVADLLGLLRGYKQDVDQEQDP